jgi:DNA-binding GntR family transcriptional regulator
MVLGSFIHRSAGEVANGISDGALPTASPRSSPMTTSMSASCRGQLAEPEDTTRENILAEAGYEQVYDIDEIITRMPTPDEVERLTISAGTPVAEHIRTGYTATNKPVRVMVSIIPGDALILQYTIPT